MNTMLTQRAISILQTIIYLILIITSSAAATTINEKPSAYDVLQSYNFPIGILPQGIIDYTLDTTTGQFSASWDRGCSFSLKGYHIKYKPTIRGYLSDGHLSNVEGVGVKLLLFWAHIVDVRRDGGSLRVSTGIASLGLSIGNFKESPPCG